MAKYDVTHTCGHTIYNEVELFGPHAARRERLDWLAKQPCRECANAAAKEAAAAAGLPALVGSEKQIAWAETIRVKALAAFDAQAAATIAADAVAPDLTDDDRARAKDILAAQRARLASVVAAAWWIDHRNTALDMLIRATHSFRATKAA